MSAVDVAIAYLMERIADIEREAEQRMDDLMGEVVQMEDARERMAELRALPMRKRTKRNVKLAQVRGCWLGDSAKGALYLPTPRPSRRSQFSGLGGGPERGARNTNVVDWYSPWRTW